MIGIASPGDAGAPRQTWERTEGREDCADHDPLRTPYFGELHVHTAYSADAVIAFVRTLPRDAYEFATGTPIGLPPYDAFDAPLRTAVLRRPLDFAAVTDHAEGFGETQICQDPSLTPGHDSFECVALQDFLATPYTGPTPTPPLAFLLTAIPLAIPDPDRYESICGIDGVDCLAQASVVWNDTATAAEEFYDRTSACGFTTFIAYEWTSNLGLNNLHRNIIFRNDDVPALPVSYFEEWTPEGLWTALDQGCRNDLSRCDVLAIPHNSNISRGAMFAPTSSDGSPLTAAAARLRAANEPLVEILQHKGDSECRTGVGTNDELCGFEKLQRATLFGASDPTQEFPPLSFVRNALKEGLGQEEVLGVNPFRMGFVGGTDGHGSTAGATNEADYPATGNSGIADSEPSFILSSLPPSGIESNAGALTVIWAEENSRDALFEAMQHREVYATSGTRPIVRMFGGRYDEDPCAGASFALAGYTAGVPMGGELGAVRRKKSPIFAVLATKDPGGNGAPSTPLQRIQIVKGWIDDSGQAQEKVFEVAGDPDNGASVDPSTCEPIGTGFDSLCTTWTDPEFSEDQRAFYYARVLENPVCRWSTRLCNSLGVDCSDPASVAAEHQTCCDPLRAPRTIQERAWTSPIWYRPELAVVSKGKIKYGAAPDTDSLDLVLSLARMPAELDPVSTDLTLIVSDDDTIVDVTIAAGTMEIIAADRKYRYRDKAGSIDGLRRAVLKIKFNGSAILKFQIRDADLSAAEPVTHGLDVELRAGAYRAADGRRWTARGKGLKADK